MSVFADDRREFERVVETVADPIRRYLRRRVDAATADDVLSETLLALWRRGGAVPESDLVPWAIGIARLQLANALRSLRRQDRLVAKILTVDPPSDVLGAQEDDPAGELVRSAMASMRESDAEVLRLWAWEELTVPQIATVLDTSSNAVSIRLHRAKKKLRDRVGKIRSGSGHAVVTEGNDR